MPDSQTNKIAFFEGKHIRKTLHADEWWFSIIDIVEVLVGATGRESTGTT